MRRKKKRRYYYRKNEFWRNLNRNPYKSQLKGKVLKIGIIFVMVIMLFLMIRSKSEKNNEKAADVVYTPIQEHITTFEVPKEVSSRIFEEAKNNNKNVATLFATYVLEKEKGRDDESILNNISRRHPGLFASKKTKKIFKETVNCYKQFIVDIEAFPISSDYEYAFENSWNAERTYGGARKHYGTDIMDPKNERGNIPIISMSQGTVENIGWNDMGGYRVGVRTKNGAYIYYAHLNNYAPEIQKGTRLEVGDLIGYMGDSGYGKEGTTGEFPVHLHIGISTKSLGSNETWINPYYLLQYLENKDIEILKSRGIF